MALKLYDEEFDPGLLATLKRREILARSNFLLGLPLPENLHMKAKEMEQTFQEARKENPLLETTPPEAWITAEIMPFVKEVRASVDLDDQLLAEAMKRFLRRHARLESASEVEGEQKLNTTIEPYIAAIEKLFLELHDRTRSLRAILGLKRNSYRLRDLAHQARLASRREGIILHGIREKWSNQRIARELDEAGIKPRNFQEYESFREMLHSHGQTFYSLKSGIKKKHHAL